MKESKNFPGMVLLMSLVLWIELVELPTAGRVGTLHISLLESVCDIFEKLRMSEHCVCEVL